MRLEDRRTTTEGAGIVGVERRFTSVKELTDAASFGQEL